MHQTDNAGGVPSVGNSWSLNQPLSTQPVLMNPRVLDVDMT